jgi:NADH-quinone oxidoreductase subunit K
MNWYINIMDVVYVPIGMILAAIWGLVIVRRSVIIIFMSIELLLLVVNIVLIMTVGMIDDGLGLIYMLLVLTIAAGEAAVGLAILVVYYRLSGMIELRKINKLK